MSQNNTLAHGKLQRCQTQRSNTEITVEIMQTYDPLKFALARSNGSNFLLITQYEMPFNKSRKQQKRSKDRKINGKCTNGTNRRSHVCPVYFIYNVAIFLSIIMQLQMQTEIFLVLFVRIICILRVKCVSWWKCPLIFRAHLHNVFSYKSVSAVKPPHSARALIFPLFCTQ